MSSHAAFFEEHGYANVSGLFTSEEVARLRAHFMAIRGETGKHGDYVDKPAPRPEDPSASGAVTDEAPDPLQQYPRMIHMHRWDSDSFEWLLDARLRDQLTELLGVEPYAVQSMLYFKPPGARGQALHQDQLFLRVQPGTCMAAWMALDDCDVENGCLQVVDGSHKWDVLCTIPADTAESFTDITVPLPDGVASIPVVMKAGDVLFFNGQLVHGSFKNSTTDRFRRALIGHYIVGEAEKVGEFYHPVLRFDGSRADLGVSPDATTCGVWVDRAGNPAIEQVARDVDLAPAHE